MTPISHDDLGSNDRHNVDLKLVPDRSASDPQRRAWLAAAFGLPDGFEIGDAVRHGGSLRTPLSIPILGPGGDIATVVRFEEEREVTDHKMLRSVLADAELHAAAIKPNVALSAYYVVCCLATVAGRVDPRAEAGEWIQEYRRAAVPVEGFELTRRGVYAALDALRSFPYSKRLIGLHFAHGGDPYNAPKPPLLIDSKTGREWTSATHLGTFIRHDLEWPESINDRAIAGRIAEHGGARRPLNVWDRSDSKREKRIGMVLIGFPEEPKAPAEDEGV